MNAAAIIPGKPFYKVNLPTVTSYDRNGEVTVIQGRRSALHQDKVPQVSPGGPSQTSSKRGGGGRRESDRGKTEEPQHD